MVPAGKRGDLADLVALGLSLFLLQVDEFLDAWPGEHAMAASSSDLSESESLEQGN
jgi:hypothetical protein